MKNLVFTVLATAAFVTSAIAAPQWDTSSKSDRMYVDEPNVIAPKRYKTLKPFSADNLRDKRWEPTCNMYMTEREIRRNDETGGSGC
jgi:hypothetical protein